MSLVGSSTTSQVIQSARSLRFQDMPESTQATVLDLLRDGLGVLLAGLPHPNLDILKEHARIQGCAPVSPIPGTDLSTSPQEAAFILGTAIHVLDFEPMFHPPTHAVSPVLGALAALIHLKDVPPPASEQSAGDRLLSAFAAGIQLQADLRTAAQASDLAERTEVRHFPFQKQGFHPPGTAGVLGSALASALWLGLDSRQTAMALGIAASRAAGIAGNIGTMTKATHCGNAARAGVESALLARLGLTASDITLEGPGGWGEVFGGPAFDHSRLVQGMAALDCFTQPGFAFKHWPAHTAMQVAIVAALKLHAPGIPLPEHIHIQAPRFNYCNRPFPRDSDEARFSFQFNVVQALLDGRVDFSSFTDESVRRPEIHALLDRTTLELCDDIPADFTRMEVRIRLSDGRESRSDRWPGHWKAPASQALLREKFVNCARRIGSEEETAGLLDALEALPGAHSLDRLCKGLELRRLRQPGLEGIRTRVPRHSHGSNIAPPLH